MNIEQLEEVTALRNYREQARKLYALALDELIALRCGNDPMDAFSVISAEPIRAAVRDACIAYCIELETKLKSLGVRIPDPTSPLDGTADEWRRTADMYCSAWSREMRGHLPRKRHLIDALVLGTRQLVARIPGKAV